MSTLDWAAVRARYRPGDPVRPLVGGSVLTVVSVDEERICVGQRLWQACVSRAELETALALLAARSGPTTGLELAEELRRHYAGGPQVTTECSRVPNLSAIILTELGHLDRA